MIGRVYFNRKTGLVRVLERWNGKGPRNVAVLPIDENGDARGKVIVRPFRGLRKP